MRLAPRYVTGSIREIQLAMALCVWLLRGRSVQGSIRLSDDTKGIFAEKYLEYVLEPRPHSRPQAMLEQLFVFAAVRALTA